MSEYQHGELYVYDATSQTFDPAVNDPFRVKPAPFVEGMTTRIEVLEAALREIVGLIDSIAVAALPPEQDKAETTRMKPPPQRCPCSGNPCDCIVTCSMPSPKSEQNK